MLSNMNSIITFPLVDTSKYENVLRIDWQNMFAIVSLPIDSLFLWILVCFVPISIIVKSGTCYDVMVC